MELFFSVIVPVYNRPQEIKELLESLKRQTFSRKYEIVIVEDGSTETAKAIVDNFIETLSITYLQKSNSGPGDSRNYGMKRAKGNYYIILDSDCILIPEYLDNVHQYLQQNYVDAFGGPDGAHDSFTVRQKAINYTMTSFWTTGGIRGGKKSVGKFQPRSFNMGISKDAFEVTGGFRNIHPGEDPDLSFRIWKKGFETRLFPKALVFHKRRINWSSFFNQVIKFGMVRPILNKWHPNTAKITYWFPSLFCLFFFIALLSAILFKSPWLLYAYVGYMIMICLGALVQTKKIGVALLAPIALIIQFAGYGYGFLKSTVLLAVNKRKAPEVLFPKLFFSTN